MIRRENGPKMTLETLPDQEYQQQIYGVPDSLARTFQKTENKKDLQEKNQDSSEKLYESLGKQMKLKNPLDYSLKTLRTCYQSIKDGTSSVFSIAWTKSGMMQNGKLLPQQRVEFRTIEQDFSLLEILENETSEEYLVDLDRVKDCVIGICEGKVFVREATKQGYNVAYHGDTVNLAQPKSKTRRGRVGKGVANTLLTSREQAVLTSDDKLRWLTERESWRLQGIPDSYFEKAAAVTSKNQLYKQAGNGVTVDVVYEIAKRL